MSFLSDVRVKATFDQNPLATTDRVLEYTPASGKQFSIAGYGAVYVVIGSVSQYSRGQARFDASGARSFAGRKQMVYTSPRVHRDTVANLISDLEGQVTAYLTEYGTTYAYYNALLSFDYEPDDLNNGILSEWGSLTWTFSIVETL